MIEVNKKTGAMRLEGMGYEGMSCQQDIDDALRALNAVVESEENKEVYWR